MLYYFYSRFIIYIVKSMKETGGYNVCKPGKNKRNKQTKNN